LRQLNHAVTVYYIVTPWLLQKSYSKDNSQFAYRTLEHSTVSVSLASTSFHSRQTLRTVPLATWCLYQSNATVMKPFNWTLNTHNISITICY